MWVKGKGRPPPCMAKEDAAAAAGWLDEDGSETGMDGRLHGASGEGRTAAARGRRASGGSRLFRTAEEEVAQRRRGGGERAVARGRFEQRRRSRSGRAGEESERWLAAVFEQRRRSPSGGAGEERASGGSRPLRTAEVHARFCTAVVVPRAAVAAGKRVRWRRGVTAAAVAW
ncbi:penicillin-binding protein [Sesbania bispinosa]|nr:penicillin-binding protein [Sesbania bispinosa]